MKLKVLDAIPAIGSISLHDLAKATGVQESLLGAGRSVGFATTEVCLYIDWVLQNEWLVCSVRDYDFYSAGPERGSCSCTDKRFPIRITGN